MRDCVSDVSLNTIILIGILIEDSFLWKIDIFVGRDSFDKPFKDLLVRLIVAFPSVILKLLLADPTIAINAAIINAESDTLFKVKHLRFLTILITYIKLF